MPKRISLCDRSAIRSLSLCGWTNYKISRELKIDWRSVKRWANSKTQKDKPFELCAKPNPQNTRFWGNNPNNIERVFEKDKKPKILYTFAAITYTSKSEIFFYVESREIKKGVNKGLIFFEKFEILKKLN